MRIIILMPLVAALTGCPDPPAKTPAPTPSPPAQTSTSSPRPEIVPIKTGPETLEPVPKTGDGKIGIQANTKDPVCGRRVSITNPGGTHTFGDTAYLFCSEQCAETFKANPKKYLRRRK